MKWNVAQVNIAKTLDLLDSPLMADFTNNLTTINTLAEQSPGFVWRFIDEPDATPAGIQFYGDAYLLVNLSVWESPEALSQYVYQSAHGSFLKRRKEWFEKIPQMHMALWYIPADHTPTVAEAVERLEYLRKNGETPFAFTYKKKFTPEEALQYIPVYSL